MTAQTSRYKLTYPTGSDLVSGAPAQFKSMADSVEKALGEVDDRQTANAVKPVVRPTLAQLQDASAVTGQTGYVTADTDPAADGMYVRGEDSWIHVRTPQRINAIASKIGSVRTLEGVSDGSTTTVHLATDNVYFGQESSAQLGTLREGCRPAVPLTTLVGVSGAVWMLLSISTGGVITVIGRYGSATANTIDATVTFVNAQ